MMKKIINQNTILDLKLYNSFDYQYIFSNSPLKRTSNINENAEEKKIKLEKLKEKIKSIKDCDIKNNTNLIFFSSGFINSKIMIIGDSPSEEDNNLGAPFTGKEGVLLEKMLLAINLNKSKVYITNFLNFFNPKKINLTNTETKKYGDFLIEHISIINPKILIFMGTMQLEAIFNEKKLKSIKRGVWEKITINQKIIECMITFHPSYLLKKPEEKKLSWIHLKNIKKKAEILNLKI